MFACYCNKDILIYFVACTSLLVADIVTYSAGTL